MTQGIWIGAGRPLSKKVVKEEIAERPWNVRAQATSFFGGEYDGPISDMPLGTTITFVGPDPERSRKFYGTITRTAKGITVK